jgi:hypothetical protein
MPTAVIYDRYGNVVEDDDIVPDGGTVRVAIPFMDALSAATRRVFRDDALPPTYDGMGNPAGRRPGFVFGPPGLTADAAAAYAAFKAWLSDAWRSPSAHPGVERDNGEDNNDRGDDGTRGTGGEGRATHYAAAAYADYCTRIANAWRTAR